jgi:hypothetical protein
MNCARKEVSNICIAYKEEQVYSKFSLCVHEIRLLWWWDIFHPVTCGALRADSPCMSCAYFVKSVNIKFSLSKILLDGD